MQQVQHHEFADDIIVTGYAEDEDLPALYRSATALVYPSLFEGFGLPPLEAMACGTPVITSDNSSLPEVVGEAGILVDALDENSIGQAILQVCSDETLRNKLRSSGIERAKIFSWREAARKTLAVYQAS
jgi:glycosyltransferase involved in cell wall biosynthesis